MRRTQLEMGSLASTIVCADADLERAARAAVAAGVLRKSGQVCTSVQRLYVHADVIDEVGQAMAGVLKAVTAGDPSDPATGVGPLISGNDATRVKAWIDQAVDGGASVVAGGGRERNVVEPTVLAGVALDATIMQQELFGPVVLLRPFTDLDEAIAEANATPYGLASGIFTSNIGVALVHALEYPLGAAVRASHGRGNGLLLPYVMEFNKSARLQSFVRIAELMGASTVGLSLQGAADVAIEAVRNLRRQIGIPDRLSAIGVREVQLRGFAEAAIGIQRILRVNPRPVTVDDLEGILRAAY